jgi:hypothetical protein
MNYQSDQLFMTYLGGQAGARLCLETDLGRDAEEVQYMELVTEVGQVGQWAFSLDLPLDLARWVAHCSLEGSACGTGLSML